MCKCPFPCSSWHGDQLLLSTFEEDSLQFLRPRRCLFTRVILSSRMVILRFKMLVSMSFFINISFTLLISLSLLSCFSFISKDFSKLTTSSRSFRILPKRQTVTSSRSFPLGPQNQGKMQVLSPSNMGYNPQKSRLWVPHGSHICDCQVLPLFSGRFRSRNIFLNHYLLVSGCFFEANPFLKYYNQSNWSPVSP